MTRHRWGDRNVISPNKTERDCLNECGIVKVTRRELEGGRAQHWVEFWRGLERIDCVVTPPCERQLDENDSSEPRPPFESRFRPTGLSE